MEQDRSRFVGSSNGKRKSWNLSSSPFSRLFLIGLLIISFVLLLRLGFSTLNLGTRRNLCYQYPRSEFCKDWRHFEGDQFFTQLTDHTLTISENNHFSQRYFVNSEYYKPGGPALLFIGGEKELMESKVTTGLAYQLAKAHSGIVYALEHRYYGKSHPFLNLTVPNLKFLTSEQALQDLVYFTTHITHPATKRPLSSDTRWFLVGGSYAGNLAVWGREGYPERFHGAIASSPPLEARSDFFEYDQFITKAVKEECATSLNSIALHVDELYSKPDKVEFNQFREDLNCTLITDDLLFLHTVADTLALLVQYDSPSSHPNILDLCSGLAATSDLPSKLQSYITTLKQLHQSRNGTCRSFSGTTDLQHLHHPDPHQFYRQWIYQSCQEFGYFHTAPPTGLTTRSRYLTETWYQTYFCGNQEFFDPPIGPPATDKINRLHSIHHLKLDHTIITNGALDPWRTLSLTTPSPPTTSASDPPHPWSLPHDSAIILIDDVSHVRDLGPIYVNDPPSLIQAHKTTFSLFRRWLK